MADYTRGDYDGKRGTQIHTDNLTFTGTGGVNTAGAIAGASYKKGATNIIDTGGGLVSQNVDGQIVAVGNWKHSPADTIAATVMGSYNGNATLTAFVAPRAGSVIGMWVHANTAPAAGHCTFSARVGATAVTLSCIMVTASLATGTYQGTGTAGLYKTADKGRYTFAAGKNIDIIMNSDTLTTSLATAGLLLEM